MLASGVFTCTSRQARDWLPILLRPPGFGKKRQTVPPNAPYRLRGSNVGPSMSRVTHSRA